MAAAMVLAGCGSATSGDGVSRGNDHVGTRDASRAGSSPAVPAMMGPDWQLTGLTTPDGTSHLVARPARFHLDGNALRYSDGCNSGSGTGTVTGPSIVFGDLTQTAMGCVGNAALETQRTLIDRVISDSGSAQWVVHDRKLTLSEPGGGTLSYTVPVGVVEHRSDPADVFSGQMTLQTIQSAPSGSPPGASVSARSAPAGAHVVWDNGTLAGSDGCNDFRATYRYTDTTLSIADVVFPHPRPCPSSYGWTNILTSGAHWSSEGADLTITAHGEALIFSMTNR